MAPGTGADGADVLYGDARRGKDDQDGQFDAIWQHVDPEAEDYTSDCPARSGDYRYRYLLWEQCEPEEQDEYGYPVYHGPGMLIGSFTCAADAEAARSAREDAAADKADDPDLDYSWKINRHAAYDDGKVPQERGLYIFTYSSRFAELGYGCHRTIEHVLSDQQLLGYQAKIDLTAGQERLIVSSVDRDLAVTRLQQLMKEHQLGLDPDGVLRPDPATVYAPDA